MRISNKGYFICALTSLLVMLTGCGSGSSGSDPVNAVGRISLGISDGPIHDAKNVCIRFTEIEFKGEGPSILITLDPAETINLLDFQGANAYPILTNHELPAGEYQWMRLGVDAVKGGRGGTGVNPMDDDCVSDAGSYLVMGDAGTVHNLYVPSGANSGLKMVGGLTIAENSDASFTAEFDLGKSLTAPPGLDPDVILRPAIHLVNNAEVGTLTGLVDSELATAIDADGATCAPSVYVFNGGVTPNAIANEEEDTDDPIATALVNEVVNDDEITEYRYTVGFLLEGAYEAAFTCNGTDFEPIDGKPVSIIANEVTTVDFP